MRSTLARTQIKTFIEVAPIQPSICPCVSNGRLPDGHGPPDLEDMKL